MYIPYICKYFRKQTTFGSPLGKFNFICILCSSAGSAKIATLDRDDWEIMRIAERNSEMMIDNI